ncbi:RDD family protein [Aliikangiella maris]|uniref:RDD family protein n=2 Tax=Aliikangiella maris TaxID=3162458 RepID=A0ABV3MRG3_9GAMM
MAKSNTKATSSSSSQTKITVQLASFFKRLIAWVYDLLGGLAVFILALTAGLALINLIAIPFNVDGEQLSLMISQNPLWSVYLLLCVQYYYVWCWVKGGQTVGMRAWRLKVCKPDGQLLDWKEGYLRSLASLGGIGTIWALIDKDKRGLQDLVCNSRVIQLPKNLPTEKKPLI